MSQLIQKKKKTRHNHNQVKEINTSKLDEKNYRYLQNIRNKIAIITHIEDHFAKTEFKLKNKIKQKVLKFPLFGLFICQNSKNYIIMLYILGPLVYNIPNQYQPLFCAKDSNIKNPEGSVNWNLSYCKTKKIVYR